MKKIGILGITANPPHAGHVNAAIQALSVCDEVWVSPSYYHAFNKPSMASYEDRLFMTYAVFASLVPAKHKNKIVVKELDKRCHDATGKNPVYTYDLLTYIAACETQPIELIPVFGEDTRAVLYKYYQSEQLQAQYTIFYAQEQDKSHSTDLRALFQAKNTMKLPLPHLRKMMGKNCLEYCLSHNLYQAPQPLQQIESTI